MPNLEPALSNSRVSAPLRLIREIVEHRSEQKEKSYRRIRSALRRGSDESTEHYAYPYVLPALPPDATPHDRVVLLRMAALTAEFSSVPAIETAKAQEHRSSQSFGRWCFELSRVWRAHRGQQGEFSARNPDPIGQRLAYLHTQDLEEMIRSVRRLLAMASTSGIAAPPLDYYSLYRTLLHWGNGYSEESRRVRMRILRDYYSSFSLINHNGTESDAADASNTVDATDVALDSELTSNNEA